jgi:trimethylamine:corrinoid methyltransferase-like protein
LEENEIISVKKIQNPFLPSQAIKHPKFFVTAECTNFTLFTLLSRKIKQSIKKNQKNVVFTLIEGAPFVARHVFNKRKISKMLMQQFE